MYTCVQEAANCSGLDASSACGRALGPGKVDPAYQDRRIQRRAAGRDDGPVGALAAPGRRRRGCYDRAWHAGRAVLDCRTPRRTIGRIRAGAEAMCRVRCSAAGIPDRIACDLRWDPEHRARTNGLWRHCRYYWWTYSWRWRRQRPAVAGRDPMASSVCFTQTPRRAMHMHRTGRKCAPPRNGGVAVRTRWLGLLTGHVASGNAARRRHLLRYRRGKG